MSCPIPQAAFQASAFQNNAFQVGFLPNQDQQTMLRIFQSFQTQGLNVTRDTIISTAYAWRLGHNYVYGRTPPQYPPWTIGQLDTDYCELVSAGLIPSGL